MAYKVIPAAVAKAVDRNWTRSFLVWLDTLLATLGGAQGPGAFSPVRLISAGALNAYTYDPVAQTLTFNVAGAQTIDGAVTALNDRLWSNNGAAGKDQGLYVVTTKGGAVAEVWTRAQDANSSAEFVPGKLIEAGPDGTANANAIFELTSASTFVLDTGTPTIGAPSNVVTTNTAQSITGAKSFSDTTFNLWNAAKTFKATFSALVTAARTYTFPDASTTFAGLSVAQLWTALQTFKGSIGVAINNAVDTFATTIKSSATAARLFTLPDVDMTPAQATVATGSTTPGAGGGTAPDFTGTSPVAAVNPTALFSGTGQSSAGQVITTSDNQTMTLNQCAGMWFISATHGPYLIASNTAVADAPAVLTIYGAAPTTDAGTYKILTGLTPIGTVASHTHTGAAHTHAQT
jgi:hypothetical protein